MAGLHPLPPYACHMPVADFPEQLVIVGTASNTSPISKAKKSEFGSPHRRPVRTSQELMDSISQLQAGNYRTLHSYKKAAKWLHLYAVPKLFQLDWVLGPKKVWQSLPSS